MKKKLLQSLLILACTNAAVAQDFLGISTGNYAGVTGVLLQPASIADSRHKFDVNIFSTGINYSNNYFLLNRDAILKFNKNNFQDYETFKARYLSEANLGTGERAFFNITNRTQLPLSFMATLGKKSAIAFNMQSRSMIQGRNITRELASMAYNGFYYEPLNNQSLDASGLSINSLNWVEAGLTYARVLYTSDKHFIKAAFTGKYLGGVASLNLGSDNFQIGVNTDSTINFSANNFRYNHNENADFDMVFDKNFRPDASAFGFDAGLVYEYRGNLKNNRYIRNDDDISYEDDRRDVNKYIFKLGVSLLDMGMFRFNKPANVQSFNADVASWDVRNSNYNTIQQFDTALAARVTAIPGDGRSYNVYLPAALSIQLDIRFVKGLFLNAMAYRPLATGAGSGVRFDNYGYYAITPRYERRRFGIYLPYSFADKNSITNYRENRLGATLRMGPLFIGSSNLGTMLFNNNLSAADVHVGLKLGITYGKPSKVSRFFERQQTAVQPLPQPLATADTIVAKAPLINKKPDTIAPLQNRIAVDYNKGLVYGDDRKGSIIIINNNFYYDTSGRAKNNDASRQVNMYNADSLWLHKYVDSIKQSAVNKRQVDTARQKLQDSINQKKLQLDSLIRNLQELRQQMDSSSAGNSFNNRAYIQQQDTLLKSTNHRQRADSSRTKLIADNKNTGLPGDTVTQRQQLQQKDDTSTIENTAINRSTGTQKDTINYRPGFNDSTQKIADQTKTPDQNDTIKGSQQPALNTIIEKEDSAAEKKLLSQEQKSSKKKIAVANSTASSRQQKVKDSPKTFPDNSVDKVTVTSPVASPANDAYREELYQKYSNESARLQQEINSLRQRADNNSTIAYQPATPYPYPVVVPQPAYTQPAVTYKAAATAVPVRDTIYIRDTIRIQDTVNLRDTLTVADTVLIRDTVNNRLAEQRQPVAPLKADTVMEKINYRLLPAEVILFGTGQSAVRKLYNNKLNYIISILQRDSTLNLSITGHTDPTGPVAINEALSLKRALAVKNYFTSGGIQAGRLITGSAGSSEPIITGNSKDANSQNRRAVIKIN